MTCGRLVERRRECDQKCRHDRRQDQWQRDRAKRPQAARAEVVRSLLERDVDLLEPRHENEDRVREADHDMSDDDRQNRARDPDRMEEQEQRDSEDHVRDHERAQKQCRDGRPSPDATTGQRDRGEHAEHDGTNAGDRRDDRARLQRSPQVAVGEELVVPVEGESAQRERRQL